MITNVARCVADGEFGKHGKRIKKVDDADKTWIVLERHIGCKIGGELSPVDPAKVCGQGTMRSGGRASYWPIIFVERSF